MKDFFVSYNKEDLQWAEWISWTLEAEGFSVVLQAWDFRSGSNFVVRMQQATSETARTIAVLSEHYMKAEFTYPEWADAFARDPKGEKRILVPVRVSPCKPEGLLAQIIYTDLSGLNEHDAKATLLQDLRERGKPSEAPEYPGTPAHMEMKAADKKGIPFPEMQTMSPLLAWKEKLAFLQIQEAEISDAVQLFTIRKRIQEAKERITEYSANPT